MIKKYKKKNKERFRLQVDLTKDEILKIKKICRDNNWTRRDFLDESIEQFFIENNLKNEFTNNNI